MSHPVSILRALLRNQLSKAEGAGKYPFSTWHENIY